MKRVLLIVLLCFSFEINYSQESYTIEGETIELKTEVEGRLDLLWNVSKDQFRYFVRTEDGTIIELKNTKSQGADLEDYKITLQQLTNGLPAKKVRFRLYNLVYYINSFNATESSNNTSTFARSKVNVRLGFSAGITNNPFVDNPENIKVPLAGLELELYEANVKSIQSVFLQARRTFDSDEFSYSTTELSLGYRYRLINLSWMSFYGQVKLATVHFTDNTILNENNIEESVSSTTFEIPLIFGVGTDIRVGKNSYITLIYSELFGLLVENQGNFSTDISLGFKFKL
jgi:hypothetical protein